MGKELGEGGLERAAKRWSERRPQDVEGRKQERIKEWGQKTRQGLELWSEGKARQTHNVHANLAEQPHPLALRQNRRRRRHEGLDRSNAAVARGTVQHGRLAVAAKEVLDGARGLFDFGLLGRHEGVDLRELELGRHKGLQNLLRVRDVVLIANANDRVSLSELFVRDWQRNNSLVDP